MTRLDPNGAAAGFNVGDVVVQVQQEKVAGPEDVARLVASARQQQRHYIVGSCKAPPDCAGSP